MRKVDPAKHEEKRQELLTAAGRCFARKGYQGASISDICAEAKISPGHLYHYFASKEEMVRALTEAGLAQAWVRFNKAAEGTNAIEALLLQKIRPDGVAQSLHFDMLAEAIRNPAMAAILEEHSRALRGLLSDFLREGQTRGEIDALLDTEVAAAILISVIDGSKTLRVRDPKLDERMSAHLLKMLISRFLAPHDSKGCL